MCMCNENCFVHSKEPRKLLSTSVVPLIFIKLFGFFQLFVLVFGSNSYFTVLVQPLLSSCHFQLQQAAVFSVKAPKTPCSLFFSALSGWLTHSETSWWTQWIILQRKSPIFPLTGCSIPKTYILDSHLSGGLKYVYVSICKSWQTIEISLKTNCKLLLTVAVGIKFSLSATRFLTYCIFKCWFRK